MVVELRTPGLKLARAQSLAIVGSVRAAFAAARDEVARVALQVMPAAGGNTRCAGECVIEVHLRDGTVQMVCERHRGLAALLRRALHRARALVLRRAGLPPADAPDPAARRAALAARLAAVRTQGATHG